MTTDLCFVGIDVSKDSLDVAAGFDAPVERFGNIPRDHRRLAARLRRLGPAKIVLEATGGYENPVLRALDRAGLPVVRVNPRPVRDFAKALNILAKTDRLDARVLAHYARLIDPPQREAPDEATRELHALADRRRQLVAMRVAENNRLEHQTSGAVVASIRASLKSLEKLTGEVETRMDEVTASSETLEHRVQLLSSVPGVGRGTAMVLVSDLPELGTLSRQQIAALAGLAPYHDDSGRRQGRRSIRGGRVAARNALYMATLTAITHNPTIREDYQRLVAAGKLKRIAHVACMRKLLTILNAMVREDKPWSPPHKETERDA